ncbi:hypothetical protein CDL15_Pgr010081 [Punica granatum]|nr:hypothetical protein CDL15_Pgr010081 [Punica granatum]
MARSLQSVKLISSLVLKGAATAIIRRGFAVAAAEGGAAASSSVRTGGARSGAALKRAGEEKGEVRREGVVGAGSEDWILQARERCSGDRRG